ncbi:MAG TPA: PLP-dependent transferase [Actinomycetota bacterium]|nr:PLP-dependent transferase [Actinomycetota bacterium]
MISLRRPADGLDTRLSRARASGALLDRSFAELAADLDELEHLAADFSDRIRMNGRVLLRQRRHLHGDSLDLIEQHQRILIAAYDGIRRDTRELRLNTRHRQRSPELLAGLTWERAGCADRLRTLTGIAASTITASEWQSPSFAHSVRSNAGTSTGIVRANVDDYRRDRHQDAAAFEAAYLAAYVDPPDGRQLRALTTSCGMSAFTTILGFLQMEGKLEGSVVLGRSVYHECRDLVRSLVPPHRLFDVPEHPPEALCRAIARLRPAVVFLDTVGNAPGALVPDVAGAVRSMREAASEGYLVIDNTALSCTFQTFGLVTGDGPRLVMFESLTKYAQFGLDRVTGGVIVAEGRDAEDLERYREHLGTNIPDASVYAIPWPNRARLERRLERLERNAVVLAQRLREAALEAGRGAVVGADHPALAGHPSHSIARGLRFRGGWLSVAFAPRHDRPEVHRRFVELALEEARRRHVPLVAGASFGLDVTRVYPTASTAISGRPFVRISPGIEHICAIEELARAFRDAVARLASDAP